MLSVMEFLFCSEESEKSSFQFSSEHNHIANSVSIWILFVFDSAISDFLEIVTFTVKFVFTDNIYIYFFTQ